MCKCCWLAIQALVLLCGHCSDHKTFFLFYYLLSRDIRRGGLCKISSSAQLRTKIREAHEACCITNIVNIYLSMTRLLRRLHSCRSISQKNLINYYKLVTILPWRNCYKLDIKNDDRKNLKSLRMRIYGRFISFTCLSIIQ